MEHHFDVDIATKYGLTEAILLNNLWFWVKKNEANDVHFHDGEYWTYSSIKALEALHPYLSVKRIRTALEHLKEEGIIVVGNYNKSAYDRTVWYAFSQKGKSIMPKGQMEDAKRANGFAPEGEPIPYIKPYIKTQIENTYREKPKKKKLGDLHTDSSLRPTLDEIETYIREKNLSVDGKTFYEFFEAGEWKDSKGNPVKSWKQKLITWSKNDTRRSDSERRRIPEAVRGEQVPVRNGTPGWVKPFEELQTDE